MSFNHVIKLLVNLFVFFFSAWCEDESRLELRALATFVLLLAQRLAGPTIRNGGMDEGRHGRAKGMKGEMGGRKRTIGRQKATRGKAGGERKEKESEVRGRFGFSGRYLHTVSVCWSSDQCPRLFSCTCPPTRGCGRPSRLRRDLGCHSRLGLSFSTSANRAVAQHSWRAAGVGSSNPARRWAGSCPWRKTIQSGTTRLSKHCYFRLITDLWPYQGTFSGDLSGGSHATRHTVWNKWPANLHTQQRENSKKQCSFFAVVVVFWKPWTSAIHQREAKCSLEFLPGIHALLPVAVSVLATWWPPAPIWMVRSAQAKERILSTSLSAGDKERDSRRCPSLDIVDSHNNRDNFQSTLACVIVRRHVCWSGEVGAAFICFAKWETKTELSRRKVQ